MVLRHKRKKISKTKKSKVKAKAKKPKTSSVAVKNCLRLWEKMEKKVTRAFKKLKTDINKNKDINIIQKDRNELLLLLGECNYLSRECAQLEKQEKKKKK